MAARSREKTQKGKRQPKNTEYTEQAKAWQEYLVAGK